MRRCDRSHICMPLGMPAPAGGAHRCTVHQLLRDWRTLSNCMSAIIIVIVTRLSSPRGLGALQQLLNNTPPSFPVWTLSPPVTCQSHRIQMSAIGHFNVHNVHDGSWRYEMYSCQVLETLYYFTKRAPDFKWYLYQRAPYILVYIVVMRAPCLYMCGGARAGTGTGACSWAVPRTF